MTPSPSGTALLRRREGLFQKRDSNTDTRKYRRPRSKRQLSGLLLATLVVLLLLLHLYGTTISQLTDFHFKSTPLQVSKTNKKFIIFRAIGNDLPPRHEFGQSYKNLKFILENEPHFPDLEVRWLVNRIVDPQMENDIIALLKHHNQQFIVDPVDLREFAAIPVNLQTSSDPDIFHTKSSGKNVIQIRSIKDAFNHHRNIYIMHNNQARNTMLEAGKASGAKYVLPWDGNCFLNENAWRSIVQDIERLEHMPSSHRTFVSSKYFSVPMARMTDNSDLLDPNFAPQAKEEPQIIFRYDSVELFNPQKRYGDIPKVDLLLRLNVSGPWFAWMHKIPKKSRDIPQQGSVQPVGWVARLFSGKAKLEGAKSLSQRADSRTAGIWNLLAKTDGLVATRLYHYSKDMLLFYDEDALARHKDVFENGDDEKLNALMKELLRLADLEVMRNGVYSITQGLQKSRLEVKHDFVSFSSREDALLNQSELSWEKEPANSHRVALSNFARNTTILALAGFITGDKRYNIRAADLIKYWFINEDTRMNPNAKHGGISGEDEGLVGTCDGLLDIAELGYVLDAIRLLDRAEAFESAQRAQLDTWFRNFAEFLEESPQGKQGFYNSTFLGTYYDLQFASVLSFTGETGKFMGLLQMSAGRLFRQFGSPEKEHSVFSDVHVLNSWSRLALIAQKVGVRLDTVTKHGGNTPFLKSAATTRLSRLMAGRAAQMQGMSSEEDDFFSSTEIIVALFRSFRSIYGEGFELTDIPRSLRSSLEKTTLLDAAPVVHPGAMIPPFWNLGIM